MAIAAEVLGTWENETVGPISYTFTKILPIHTVVVVFRGEPSFVSLTTNSDFFWAAVQDNLTIGVSKREIPVGTEIDFGLPFTPNPPGHSPNTFQFSWVLVAFHGIDIRSIYSPFYGIHTQLNVAGGGVLEPNFAGQQWRTYVTDIGTGGLPVGDLQSGQIELEIMAYVIGGDYGLGISAGPPNDTPVFPSGWSVLSTIYQDTHVDDVYEISPPGIQWWVYSAWRENAAHGTYSTDGLSFGAQRYEVNLAVTILRGVPSDSPLDDPPLDDAADYAVMLSHTPEGHLLRCYRDINGVDPATGDVRVEVSRDAGITWSGSIVNPDAPDAAAEDAVPQILVQPDGLIWCCWHTAGNEARCFYSLDDGANWTERVWGPGPLTSCKRPVPWQSGGRLGMVYQRTSDSAWVTIRSDDQFGSRPPEVSSLTGIPAGLPQVVTTPGGDLILIYAATGMHFKQRVSADEGEPWSSETDLDAQGYFPTVADGPGWGRGIITYGPALADLQRSLYVVHPWQDAEDAPAITLDQDHGLTTVGTWVGMVWLPNGVLVASAKNRTPAIKTYWLDESADPPTWTEIV